MKQLTAQDWGRLLNSECVDTKKKKKHRITADFLAWYFSKFWFLGVDKSPGRFKPLLRTFDQMTEEERRYFKVEFLGWDEPEAPVFRLEITPRKVTIIIIDGNIEMPFLPATIEMLDYLDSIHIDIRGWIDAGLAIREGDDA